MYGCMAGQKYRRIVSVRRFLCFSSRLQNWSACNIVLTVFPTTFISIEKRDAFAENRRLWRTTSIIHHQISLSEKSRIQVIELQLKQWCKQSWVCSLSVNKVLINTTTRLVTSNAIKYFRFYFILHEGTLCYAQNFDFIAYCCGKILSQRKYPLNNILLPV
jgi:hypothetical protein